MARGATLKRKRRLQSLDIFKTPVYVINLKQRKDRWEQFLEQGPAVKMLKLQRSEAVNGKALNYLKDPRISTYTRLNIMRNDRRTHREVASLGAIGCSLSHIKIWKKLVASGAPYAVIMEDDARFDADQLQKINELAKTIPDSAQVWLFGMYKPNMEYEPIARSKWNKVYRFTATHAYAITREAAKKFLEQATPIEMHIDHYMAAMSVLYDIPMLMHDDLFISYGGALKKGSKTTVIESNTSQHTKDGCSACHVPDHLSRFYRQVGPKTRKGRIVHGIQRTEIDRKVLTYKSVGVKKEDL